MTHNASPCLIRPSVLLKIIEPSRNSSRVEMDKLMEKIMFLRDAQEILKSIYLLYY
jgi:hypothetical protein